MQLILDQQVTIPEAARRLSMSGKPLERWVCQARQGQLATVGASRSRDGWRTRASASAWTGAAGPWTTFVERVWRSMKDEEVYLRDYADGAEAWSGLQQYFLFYNTERRHQSLGGSRPLFCLPFSPLIIHLQIPD